MGSKSGGDGASATDPPVFALARAALPQPLSCGRHETAECRIAPYAIPAFHIDFIRSGRGSYRVDGRAVDLSADAAYCFRPGEVVSVDCPRWREPLAVHALRFAWPAGGARALGLEAFPRRIALLPAHRTELIARWDELIAAHRAGDALAASGWLVGVLATLAAAARAPSGSAGDRRLAVAVAFMERHRARPLRVAQIAEAAGLTEDYFSRQFRARMGATPLQHLIALRLDELRHLLLAEPALSAGAAARRCGFDGAKHAARLFRRRFGATPDAFRRQRAGGWPSAAT